MSELDGGPFFTRGVSADIDPMTFPCTEDHRHLFCGAVYDIVAVAREKLSAYSDEEVRDIMLLADHALVVMLRKDLFVDGGGKPHTLDRLRKQSAIQCLPVACMGLSEAKESMRTNASELDDAGIEWLSTVSPAHVCLAIALGHGATAIHRLDTSGFFQVGVWHAMVAAEAMGVAYLQMNEINYQDYVRSQGGRKSSNSRWSPLIPVKVLAFRRRQELSHLSRSAAIDQMLSEILAAARDAGLPFTGGNPKRTIEKWFRDADVK